MRQAGRPMPGHPGYRPMMGPAVLVALPYVTAALAAAGTAMTVKGQMDQQAAAGAQANYLAQMDRQRRTAADQQARDAVQRGAIAEQKQRDLTAQRAGTQQAVLAAQGTDLEGSPTSILGDTARAGEQDALTIRNNAAREAWGYQVQGAGFGANANLNDSFRPSYLGAGASLLSGASSLADKWSKFQWPGSSSYDLGKDTLRTAGDADLGGYSGGYQ